MPKRLLTVTSRHSDGSPLIAFYLPEERRFVTPHREQDLPEIVDLIRDGSIKVRQTRRLPR